MPHMPTSSSYNPPSTDFTVLHEIMRSHISRGNSFSVLATLALSVVHENPVFWQTCTYRDGIAAAVIDSYLENHEEREILQQQTENGNMSQNSNNIEQDSLSSSELYVMLRRIVGEDHVLRRVIDQLEEGNEPMIYNNNNNNNNNGGVSSPSSSSTDRPVDLAELRAVLQERCRNREEQRIIAENMISSGGNTTPRVSEYPQASYEMAEGNKFSNNHNDDNDEIQYSDALNVLAKMPALPGSTREVNSFDIVGDFMRHGDRGRMERIREPDISRTFPKSNISRGYPSNNNNNDFNNNNNNNLQLRPKQRRFKFTPEEDAAILRGVVLFAEGPGRFESIHYAFRDVWVPGRTATNLYDHWRGTLRQRAILQQGGYRGKASIAQRGGNNEPN